METSQHDMTSTLNTLVSLPDETMAVEMSPHQFMYLSGSQWKIL